LIAVYSGVFVFASTRRSINIDAPRSQLSTILLHLIGTPITASVLCAVLQAQDRGVISVTTPG
jgi:hypothetical protein